MAEAVGLAASVIGIAGLAGKIVKTTYKVKGLLEEVSNVPEDLQRCLDQIQVFAPILATEISDDGPPDLRGAFCAAVSQCQRAANDLGKLAEDLSTQVHANGRGKLRRKVQAAKVVLQKDIFAAHEKRLSSAMQMLIMASQMYGLAQQRYLLDLQRSQPNVIVTEILAQLPLKEPWPPSPEPRQQIAHGRSNVVSYHRRDQQAQNGPWNRQFLPNLRLGSTRFTGSIEFESSNKCRANESEQPISVTRLRVQLPRWLSTRTLDSILQRSQAGWNCLLHVSRYHSRNCEASLLVFDAIISRSSDSLQRLQPLLANGQISIHDRFEFFFDIECTLFSVGMIYKNWPLCAFLATYDAPSSGLAFPGTSWEENDNEFRNIQKVFSHYYEDPSCWAIPFYSYEGSVDWFHTLRCSVWPDRDFYDTSSTLLRIKMAWYLLPRHFNGKWTSSPSKREPLIRYLLYRDGQPNLNGIGESVSRIHFETYNDLNSDYSQLQYILVGIGTIAFLTDGSDENPWLGLLRELVAYIVNEVSRIQSDPDPIFTFLFQNSIHMQYLTFRNMVKRKVSQAALWTLKKQLHIISGLGTIDLCAFGKYFKSRMGYFEPDLDMLLSAYGDDPEDWKFWVLETTDRFAGEFWEWADPKPMWMPGAWVDE